MSADVRRLCMQGRLKDALHIWRVMEQRGIRADSSTYASLLQVCVNTKALPEGKLIHAHMIGSGFNPEIFLRTKLVIMYAKCGSLGYARRVFDEMPTRNVVSWTAMIAEYARLGQNEEAFEQFYQMQRQGIQPDEFAFSSVLPACANMATLEHGKEVHESIIRSGFRSNMFVGSALVDMYAKCGSTEDARKVFNEMPQRNVVSWTAMIAGYVQNGQVHEALQLFQKMPERDVVSWNAMIAGYARDGKVDDALKLFQKVSERDVISWNAMVAGYAQNEQVDEALKFFQKIPDRNAVSWTAMIAGYAQNGLSEEALKLFLRMQLAGVKSDAVTFTSVLPACANSAALKFGKEVHGNIITSGFRLDVFVRCAVVDMYAKCGSLEDAHKVFDEMPEQHVVSWNALIAGYAQNGHVDDAMKLFQRMVLLDVISWTAMISGYAQIGQLDEALKFFQKTPQQDVISWNAMIAGYAQNRCPNEALKLLQQMVLAGAKPDLVSFTSVLPACADLTSVINGKQVHGKVIRSGFPSHTTVASALVDMYAKCGAIDDAFQVFDKMIERDVVSWNAMILGYAKNGCGKDSLQLFKQMQSSGMKPNHVTFIGVLCACSHAGLVDDGWQYFNCMSRDYNLTPELEHYGCMVDLLGRAGHLDEAQDFISKMPIKPDAAVWGSLLGACRIHADLELGERAAEHLFELDPKNAAFSVLLSNIYAAAGKWDGVEKVRKNMRDERMKKMPGCSWIEVNNKVYSFLARDGPYSQTHKLYPELERLPLHMEETGSVPNRNFMLHDVEEDKKKDILLSPQKKTGHCAWIYPLIPWGTYSDHQEHSSVVILYSATRFISEINT